jgi:hypothetical protein
VPQHIYVAWRRVFNELDDVPAAALLAKPRLVVHGWFPRSVYITLYLDGVTLLERLACHGYRPSRARVLLMASQMCCSAVS